MFAQTLQDLLVVNESVQRPQDEDVEGDVANLLQFKLPAQTLQPAGSAAHLLQLHQNLRLLVEVGCERLQTEGGEGLTVSTHMLHFHAELELTFRP